MVSLVQEGQATLLVAAEDRHTPLGDQRQHIDQLALTQQLDTLSTRLGPGQQHQRKLRLSTVCNTD